LSFNGSEIFETKSGGKAELEKAIEIGISAAQKVKKDAGKLLQSCISSSSDN
jgi:hypothetical protein